MTKIQTIEEYLQQAFAPTKRGLVGLVDQILTASIDKQIEFERVGEQLICRLINDSEPQEAPLPIPVTAFRSLLARIAALVSESNPESSNLYEGEGSLNSESEPTKILHVSFANLPKKQFLKLQSTRF